MGRRSALVEEHTVRVGKANKSEFKVACKYCRENGEETHFVSRTDAVNRHLKLCKYYTGAIPTITYQFRDPATGQLSDATNLNSPSQDLSNSSHNTAALALSNALGQESVGTPSPRVPSKRSIDGDVRQPQPQQQSSAAAAAAPLPPPPQNYVGKPNQAWITNMERQILKTVVSTGMPFSMVEDKCFREMLEVVSPQLKTHPDLIPSHNRMNFILQEADNALRDEVSKELNICKRVTLTVDAWMNCVSSDNHQEQTTLAFVVKTPSSKLLAWKWDKVETNNIAFDAVQGQHHHDISEVANSQELANKLNGVVVTRAALKHIEQEVKLPQGVFLLACYDEELKFMVGDILSQIPKSREAVLMVNSLVDYFRDADKAPGLSQLAAEFGLTNLNFYHHLDVEWDQSFHTLDLLTTHREDVIRTLDLFASSNYLSTISNPEEAAQAAIELRDQLHDESLWAAVMTLEEVYKIMTDYKSKVIQENGTRLRMILPVALELWRVIEPKQNSHNIKISLNQRLQTWDVDTLVLATIFDPNVRRSIFNKDVISTEMIIRIFENAVKTLALPGIDANRAEDSMLQYLRGVKWPFNEEKYNTRSLISFYWPNLINQDHPELAQIGLNLESCTVNGVDTDKLFTDMGSIHSALRSNKTVMIETAMDPELNNNATLNGEKRPEKHLTTLLDICLQEATFNTMTKHANAYKFETLFADMTQVGLSFDDPKVGGTLDESLFR